MVNLHRLSAYGGAGWSPRTTPLSQEVGSIWEACGQTSEWSSLKAVLLHPPGPELTGLSDPDAWQLLAPMDHLLARDQHDSLARAYRAAGVAVHYVEPYETPSPNQMFVADLMFMTPEGAILGRPASTVRAGEERHVAARLSALGIPILRSIRGTGTFEGADAAWIDAQTVLLATGLRTNAEGASQVTAILDEMGVSVIPVGLPHGSMHLMGLLRFADRDLAIAWPGQVPYAAVVALRQHGYQVLFLPAGERDVQRASLNFVTLAPRKIMMAEEYPAAQAFLERAGIECLTVAIDQLAKAAGGIACLTGILHREM